jgi:hypothetical protein
MAYPIVDNTSASVGVVHAGLHQPNSMATGYPGGFNVDYQLPADFPKYVTNGAGVSVPSENLGFYFSGMQSSNNGSLSYFNGGIGAMDMPSTLVSTMVRVDTQHFDSADWSTIPLPSTIQPRAEASMVWIPVGSHGALVVIGGVSYPADIYDYDLNQTLSAQNSNQSPLFMTNIPIYDIGGNKWYVQQTSGKIPPATAQACAVVASASDGSSHNIYVYGGYGKIFRWSLDSFSNCMQMVQTLTHMTTCGSFQYLRSSGHKHSMATVVMQGMLMFAPHLIQTKCFLLAVRVLVD